VGAIPWQHPRVGKKKGARTPREQEVSGTSSVTVPSRLDEELIRRIEVELVALLGATGSSEAAV
jgi:hypothetical protein